IQSTINWISNSYTAPTNMTPYTTTTVPVRCASGCSSNGSPVVLSGVSDIASNYPDSSVSSAYNTALSNQTLPGLSSASYSTYATLMNVTGGNGVTWLAGAGGGEPGNRSEAHTSELQS